MKIKQLNAKLMGCPVEVLRDEKFLNKVVESMVSELEMNVVKKMSHYYGPGVSVVFLVSESHVSIHTYPEFNLANVEIESCKESSDVLKGLEVAISMLKPKEVQKHLTEHPFPGVLEYVRTKTTNAKKKSQKFH